MALILIEEKFQGKDITQGIVTTIGGESTLFKPFDVVVLSETMQLLALKNARKMGVKIEVYEPSKHNPLVSAYLKRSEAALRGQDLVKRKELLRPFSASDIQKMSKDDLEELCLKLKIFGDPDVASQVPRKSLEDLVLATWGLSRGVKPGASKSVPADDEDGPLTAGKLQDVPLSDLLVMLKSKGLAKATDTVRSLGGDEEVRKMALKLLPEG